MINANELRIGNWVLVLAIDNMDARFARIVVIDKLNGFRVSSDINDDYGMGCHFDVEPIPLTPEILGQYACGNNYPLLSSNSGNDCFYLSGTKLKYVHQFQNLYFALTGEELEINL